MNTAHSPPVMICVLSLVCIYVNFFNERLALILLIHSCLLQRAGRSVPFSRRYYRGVSYLKLQIIVRPGFRARGSNVVDRQEQRQWRDRRFSFVLRTAPMSCVHTHTRENDSFCIFSMFVLLPHVCFPPPQTAKFNFVCLSINNVTSKSWNLSSYVRKMVLYLEN